MGNSVERGARPSLHVPVKCTLGTEIVNRPVSNCFAPNITNLQLSLDTRGVVGADFLAALCARKIMIGCLKMRL